MSSKKELYDRIRATSKDEVILQEMIRHGFWPKAGEIPNDPADEIRRLGELRGQVNALRTESARLHNVEALKKAAHKRRLAEARAKRVETKARRERERLERAAAWEARKQTEIVYLGEDVSSELGRRAGDDAKLVAAGLPVLQDAAAIAGALGIDVPELRWLAFNRRVSQSTHYQRFTVPKKTGGERLISAPMPRLKAVQHWVLRALVEKVPLHDAAHGFVPGRSIVSNATPHVDKAIVVNMDLKNFFPTVHYRRVKGMFRQLGYSPEAATIFGLLCTEPDVTEAEIDGRTWFVATGERHLPQGSPASPAITNVLCKRLDARLSGLATRLGFGYTRYADDLTFSAEDAEAHVGTLLKAVDGIVGEEGFVVHPDKTRSMRRGRRQEVTGIIVNDQLAVSRDRLRKFRAVLFHVQRDGPTGKTWGPAGGDLFASLSGFAAFVTMVDPDKGKPLARQVAALAQRHGWQAPKRPAYEQRTPSWIARKQRAAEEAALEKERRQAEAADAEHAARRRVVGEGDPKSDPLEEPARKRPVKRWWEFWK